MKVEVTPEDILNAGRFGEISEVDLKAAEVLFNQGLYPLAVFHMEQSIEKMVKSFLLSLGIKKTVKEVKALNHRILEMYEEILELSKYAYASIKLVEEWLPKSTEIDYIARIDTSIDKVKDLSTESGRKKLFAISSDEERLKKILIKSDEIYRELEQIVERPIKFSALDEIKNALPELFQSHAMIQSLGSKDRDFVFDAVSKGVKTGTLCFPHLASFAIIFYPHVSSSRYPDENGWNPLSYYTQELPLVKMFPKFCGRMKIKVINNFHNFLSGYQELLEFFNKRRLE
jgi:HEPN domain-containing protein